MCHQIVVTFDPLLYCLWERSCCSCVVICLINCMDARQCRNIFFFLPHKCWCSSKVAWLTVTVFQLDKETYLLCFDDSKLVSKMALELACSEGLNFCYSVVLFWQTKFFLFKKHGGPYFWANNLVNVKILVWSLECCNFKSRRCCFSLWSESSSASCIS